MARELDAILDHGVATHADSCISEGGSVSFLDQIVCPIYTTLKMVSALLLLSFGTFSQLACFTFNTCCAVYQIT